ncbi:MAG: branched-chain amino acid ABC transporter ATP-binding protein/permease [Chlorobiaceae bacterium]|nr:branched-chain amino acid ABC transporter ATP-binding protein/permease [Chlorobiaceae bacterium]NTV59775.1 branched-chain amino acid ABC transporter ATP-binding protein/permease [Chlorobiaceae bacterium]
MSGGINLGIKEKTAEHLARLALFCFLAFLPMIWQSQYALGLLTLMAVYGILLIGLDATVGYLGQVNLAQAALFGLGAYGTALAIQSGLPFSLALLAGVMAALLPGAALALPSLRLDGPQFALSTLSFASLAVIVLNESESITNGALGISVPRPLFFSMELDARRFYWFCLIVLSAVWWASGLLFKSRIGLAIEALRDSPTATDALGIGSLKHKAVAFAWGSSLAGFAGGLHVMNFGYLQPSAFGYDLMVILLLGVVFGGRRNQWGAFTGAAAVTMLPNLLSNRMMFSVFVTLGCLVAFTAPLKALLARRRPAFSESAPAAGMALCFALALFVPNLELWRKGIFALFLFSAVVGLPEGITGALVSEIRNLLRFSPEPLPAATGGISEPAPSDTAPLRTRNISKSFGGVIAVRDISIATEQGEILGLIGPNGSGKTTLINLVTGLYAPDEGSVEISGRRIRQGSLMAASAAGASRTFQNLQPFSSLTALESITVCQRKIDKPAAMALLQIVGLESKARLRCSELSFGDLRFLEIGRALATQPSLLLLDEPAAGMAKPDIARLIELISSIRDYGITILIIEHHQDVITEVCNRVAVMNGGRLIALGTPEEIRRDPLVVEAYLGGEETVPSSGDNHAILSC